MAFHAAVETKEHVAFANGDVAGPDENVEFANENTRSHSAEWSKASRSIDLKEDARCWSSLLVIVKGIRSGSTGLMDGAQAVQIWTQPTPYASEYPMYLQSW